ncbi:MAG TPA: glycogen synthase GlgA, partial [Burkholderiaceae bacterium]|nr:glycogen synthase GlgA [Burkholderiaceae bacterium]
PYLDPQGRDWSDNHRRFGLLGWVAARLAAGEIDPGWRAELLHAHDWHPGLSIAYAAADPAARCARVFTIHNLSFQGLFPASAAADLGLPPEWFTPAGVEFHGQLSFIKAALVFAQQLVAVSPTYASEILGAEHGCGLDGVLRERAGALTGILNGVDYATWDPATDRALAQRYDANRLQPKAANKAALQRELGLAVEPQAPLYGIVSRFSAQKGLDLVLAALPAIVGGGGQLAVLGSGDPALERGFVDAAASAPASIATRIGYDEPLSHRLIAGCDALLVPSRFEPCGLTQMYALRYGTVPVVRRVGGLADTVRDAGENADAATGVVFDDATPHAVARAIARTTALYRDPPRWQALIRNGMAQDFSWPRSARRYLELYQQLVPQAAGPAAVRPPRRAAPRAA